MDVGLVILDGWGLNPDPERDAVAAANTPTMDRYRAVGAAGTLETHGRRVGLPEGQMGNSEVGHLTVGAGRVVVQESARITDAIAAWRGETPAADIADPPLDENPAIGEAVGYAADNGGRVHLLGLISDGGVHSYQAHVHAVVGLVAEAGLEPVVHAFTDGRDTAPKGGADFLADLQARVDDAGGRVATVTGRYYAMDRDENWERTHRAYRAIVDREAEHTAPDAVAAVEASYERGDTDEFVEPTVVEGGPALADGDGAVFCNFRADRARQLTRMLADVEPGAWGADTDPPEAAVVTMTEYDATFDVPVAFPPTAPEATLGSALADAGETQLRIAESEKYPHVTYFLNGGREVEFDGEIRRIVQSPDVATYDLQPEMSARELTDAAIGILEDGVPACTVVNYANPDMVGHTGDFDATVTAVETVDEQLGRLLETLWSQDVHALVTADHGNADDMGTPDRPHTAHTTNPVPVVYVDPGGNDDGRSLRDDGTLADVAPTLLALLGIETPSVMTGRPLFESNEH
jgi:2,3-bisphosphoglycerate-independent phosphoglycerate mutase